MSTQQLESLVKRLEAVAIKLESTSSGSGPAPVEDGEALKAYDEYMSESVTPFLELSKKIGGDLDKCTELVVKAFAEVRKCIDVASKSKRPDDKAYGELVKPLSLICKEIGDYRADCRKSEFYNHLSGIADGIKFVLWVAVPNTPSPYCKDMVEAAQFYHNKVRVAYKNKDNGDDHKNWVIAFAKAGTDLSVYVKKYHTTGLNWNPKGSSTVATPSEAPKKKVVAKKSAPATGGKKVDLFASINKGGSVTSGLKKVKREQKTKYQTAPKPKVKFQSKAKKVKRITGKPVLELQRGCKWVVENHDGNTNLVITVESIKHTVYVYKCDNCNVIVKGKCNSITLDNCHRTNLIFDSCLSMVDIVNCQRAKVQIIGTVPTVQVDKTDGFNLFLSTTSLEATLITSKSSEMNVSVPIENDDYKEYPVPEQFVSTYSNKKLTTNVSGHF